jgi:hypothetical protein
MTVRCYDADRGHRSPAVTADASTFAMCDCLEARLLRKWIIDPWLLPDPELWPAAVALAEQHGGPYNGGAVCWDTGRPVGRAVA